MGKPFENNRSSAPTAEFLAQIIAQQTAIAKEAFAAGVRAGTTSLLSDEQVAVIAKSIKHAITTSLKKFFGKSNK